MDNRSIGLFDSGVGGLTTLMSAMKIMPNEKFIYFADTINAPFGNKGREEVYSITRAALDFFVNRDCKSVILACNTATGIGAGRLRDSYNMDILGLEPAIKVARDRGLRRVAVLTTNLTASTEAFKKLYDTYAMGGYDVIKLTDLAAEIEREIIGGNLAGITERLMLSERLRSYDGLVLGCTHYVFLTEHLERLLPNCQILDGNSGVCRNLKSKLRLSGRDAVGKSGAEIITTSNKEQQFKEIIGAYYERITRNIKE